MKLIVNFFLLLVSFIFRPALAIDCTDNVPSSATDLANYISACSAARDAASKQAVSLQSTITFLDSKIRLTSAQIAQTISQINSLIKDISTLSNVVDGLNQSLDKQTSVYLARVRESYKRRDPNPLELLLTSNSFNEYITRTRYLKIIKARDRLILSEMTSAKIDLNSQKDAKVEKQKQVEVLKNQLVSQQNDLNIQKKSKNDLLVQTQNDQKKFQHLVDEAQAELEAINAIIAGKGAEQYIRDVNKGDVIASIIQGSSCNSSGTHLHFTVADSTIVQNPFNYLKSIDHNDYSGGDPFNPTGSWDWPIAGPINFFQGYGVTWAVRNTWAGNIYNFHNGIDMNSGSSSDVHAVADGKLYRGFYNGQNGCTLNYVRVAHSGSSIDSFYLHVLFR